MGVEFHQRGKSLRQGEHAAGARREREVMKKTYRKPELKTRRLELGVFGDYSSGGRDNSQPTPVSIIENLKLHME